MILDSVFTHLQKAASGIISNAPDQVSISYWESHSAVEKTVKTLLYQSGAKQENTHILDALARKVSGLESLGVTIDQFNLMPSWKVVNKCRYGEHEAVSVGEAIAVYDLALFLVEHISSGFSCRLRFNNARFLIQVPPWAKRRLSD